MESWSPTYLLSDRQSQTFLLDGAVSDACDDVGESATHGLTPFPWIPWILWLPWLSVALSQLLYLMENAVKHKILPILITINDNIKVLILLSQPSQFS